jgi:hypothetical protein
VVLSSMPYFEMDKEQYQSGKITKMEATNSKNMQTITNKTT